MAKFNLLSLIFLDPIYCYQSKDICFDYKLTFYEPKKFVCIKHI